MLKECLGRNVIAYIDDIFIYSDDLTKHITCETNSETAQKASQCEFHVTTFVFFGYIIGQQGVSIDDNKVKAI